MERTYTYSKIDDTTVEISETEPQKVRISKQKKGDLERKLVDAEAVVVELKKALAVFKA